MKYPQIEWSCRQDADGYIVQGALPRTRDTQVLIARAKMPFVELENLRNPEVHMWYLVAKLTKALVHSDKRS